MTRDKDAFYLKCQEKRTPPQLRRWAAAQLERLSSTDAGRSDIRLRRGIAKQFIEEVYPLSLWATRLYGDREDVLCRSVLGNQPYDAVVTESAEGRSRHFHLEITLATDGYDEHLRMLYMEQHGGVSAIGKPKRTGTRAERRIEVPSAAATHQTLISQAYRQVQAALANKATKVYSPDTSLLVMLNDFFFEFDDDFSDLDALLLDSAANQKPKFVAIYVLGWRGRVATVMSRTASEGGWHARRLPLYP